MRSEFSPSVRMQAWERCNGRCEGCSAKLYPGHFAYDHIMADGLGGTPTLSNCQVLCDNCHGIKTHTEDRPIMAKADAVKKRHISATANKRPWPKRGWGNKPSNTRQIAE